MTEDNLADTAALAAALPKPLAAVVDAAHVLAARITPSAIGSAKHHYKIAEARIALAAAIGHLSATVIAFERVTELLKGFGE